MLKSSKLTPAEFLYLSNKARLEKRKSQLKARSISDSAEEESHRHYSSSNSLHGHQLGQHQLGQHQLGQHGPVEYEDSQKMQFQIHGQEGPRSYRFGHDSGAGYTTDIDPVPAAPPPRR